MKGKIEERINEEGRELEMRKKRVRRLVNKKKRKKLKTRLIRQKTTEYKQEKE